MINSTSNQRLRNRTSRRGVASLEFVMSLPFLLGIGAMIISVGIAGVHRTWTTMEVRHDVWKMRTNQPAETKSKPLSLFSASDAGVVEGESTSSFNVYAWLGGAQTANSKAAVLAGTWDHRELTDFAQFPESPHFGTILRAVGAPNFLVDAANFVASLITFRLPNQSEIDDAGEGAAEAENGVDEQRANVEAHLQQMREELAQLRRELQALQDQKTAKENEIDRLQDEYDELVRNGASAAEKAAKQAAIDRAKDELKTIKDQIKAKEDQIKKKEKDIKDLEDARDEAEATPGEVTG